MDGQGSTRTFAIHAKLIATGENMASWCSYDKTLYAALAVLLAATAATGCRPSGDKQPVTSSTIQNQRIEPRNLPAPAANQGHRAKPRAWRLRDDSPFTLVAEGLRSANVTVIDGTSLVYAEACDAPPPARPFDRDRSRSFSVWEVSGDHFAPAIPNSPATEGGITAAFGHWPSDFWLRFGRRREPHGAQHQFFHWDGGTWQTIDVGPTEKGVEPQEIFDWYEGTKVVAQIKKWHYSVSYAVEPFVVWGQTAHQPPDFSALEFPRDPGREQQMTHIEYAALPTHELFVAHELETRSSGRTTITIAHSTQSGEILLERVLDEPGSSSVAFVGGRLGPRNVVVAWGDLVRFGRHRPWMQLYDGKSSTRLPMPEPVDRRAWLVAVWLAGGQLWAQFDFAHPKIWHFDGISWKAFARIDSEVSVELASATEDGSLWSAGGPDLFRFDQDGRKMDVPFLAEPTKELLLFRLVATAPDDLWLIVAAEGEEDLIFRTKKMTSILACE